MSPLILRIGMVVCLLSSAIAWWRWTGTERRAVRFVAIWLLVGAAATFLALIAAALLSA